MSSLRTEQVTGVHHWNSTLFSFTTTRAPHFRFKNGHFVMIGLEVQGRPLLRAYSIVSANYEEQLEFFSIKVADGPLTSRLQKIKEGDSILVGNKPTGTLVVDHLGAGGRHLWLISTGTGLAPFLSIIKDPETYDRYEKVIVTHGVRYVSELAYQTFVTQTLPNHEYLGALVRDRLHYYPTVTREPYHQQGRLTDLLDSGALAAAIGVEPINPEADRFMVCGSPAMLKDTVSILEQRGFCETRHGKGGQYVIERAFVSK